MRHIVNKRKVLHVLFVCVCVGGGAIIEDILKAHFPWKGFQDTSISIPHFTVSVLPTALTTEKEPTKVKADHRRMPTHIMYLRVYLSPR